MGIGYASLAAKSLVQSNSFKYIANGLKYTGYAVAAGVVYNIYGYATNTNYTLEQKILYSVSDILATAVSIMAATWVTGPVGVLIGLGIGLLYSVLTYLIR